MESFSAICGCVWIKKQKECYISKQTNMILTNAIQISTNAIQISKPRVGKKHQKAPNPSQKEACNAPYKNDVLTLTDALKSIRVWGGWEVIGTWQRTKIWGGGFIPVPPIPAIFQPRIPKKIIIQTQNLLESYWYFSKDLIMPQSVKSPLCVQI